MTIGAAVYQGTLNVGLKQVSWAPANVLTGSGLANGWAFHPNSLVAVPQVVNGGVFQFSNVTGKLVRVEQAIFDKSQGCLTSFLNPGTTGNQPGLGVTWCNGRLTFLCSPNGNQALLGYQNDGLPQTSFDFSHAGMFPLPTSSVVLSNVPIIYRNFGLFDQVGILYGIVGTPQLNIVDPYAQTDLEAIDISGSGSGNPPFFLSACQGINAINVFNGMDPVNRTFFNKNPNHGPLLYQWQDRDPTKQSLFFPTFDNAALNTALQTSVNLTVNTWPGGFLVGVYTGGTGPTKQQCEWAMVDLDWSKYYLLNMVAEDASAATQLGRTSVTTMAIDYQGVIWYNSRHGLDTLVPLIGGFVSPPSIASGPVPYSNPIDLPCFNPCTTNP